MWNSFALKVMHDGHSMLIHLAYVASLLCTLFSVLLLYCLCFFVLCVLLLLTSVINNDDDDDDDDD